MNERTPICYSAAVRIIAKNKSLDKEQDLVDLFSCKSSEFLRLLLKRRVSKCFLLREFDSHFGVADIVLGTYKQNYFKMRGAPLDPNWLMPLSSLKRTNSYRINELCATYGLSRVSARRRLRSYEEAGYVVRYRGGEFRVIKEYKPITGFVISVEAKLGAWRRALEQAKRYRRFSDFSFVLLDDARIAPAKKHIAEFEKNDVGLVSISQDKLQLHYRPTRNDKKMPQYYNRVSEAAYRSFKECSQVD